MVLAQDPERQRLRELSGTLEARRDDIAELDLEIETLRERLAVFESGVQGHLAPEHEALRRVESVVAHLGRWSELLDQAPRRTIGRRGRRLDERRQRQIDAQRTLREEAELEEPEAPEELEHEELEPDDRLKSAYRALARQFHPDLARTEEERLRFGHVMARINDLYRAADLTRLEAMVEQAKGGEVDSPDLEIGEQIAQLEERLAWFDAVLENLRDERAELERSPTCELLRNVEQAKANGADLVADLKEELRQRVGTAYEDIPPAIEGLQMAVNRYNRGRSSPTSLKKRRRSTGALERRFDPFADKRLVRLSLDAIETAHVSGAARRQAEWIQAEGPNRPETLRLLLFAYVSEMSPFPLDGLDSYEKLHERFDALARGDDDRPSLEETLVEIDDLVEYGVRRATDSVVHTGLRFRDDVTREAIPVALRALPVRRVLKSILGVLGERVDCNGCSETVYAVPLYRTRGLDDLRANVCPLCGHAAASYWMPRGKDVQAVLNSAYLDFELVTEWSFRLGRTSVAVQLLPVQVEQMTVRDLKRRLLDDLLERYRLGVAAKHVHLLQRRKRVAEKTPLDHLENRQFGVRFTSDAPMTVGDAVETLRHRIRNRFRGD